MSQNNTPLIASVSSMAHTQALTHTTSSKERILGIWSYCIFRTDIKALSTSDAQTVIYICLAITHGYNSFNGTGFYTQLASGAIALSNPRHFTASLINEKKDGVLLTQLQYLQSRFLCSPQQCRLSRDRPLYLSD